MNLSQYIRDVENFPIEGITFKDITPLLQNPEAFEYVINQLAQKIKDADIIIGLDARGFLFAGALANKLHKPLNIVRKAGKLPYKTISIDYELEYGKNTFELNIDALIPGQTVAIIDDLLATGGTAKAACNLVEKLGGKVHSVNFVIELGFLGGSEVLKNHTINSICKY